MRLNSKSQTKEQIPALRLNNFNKTKQKRVQNENKCADLAQKYA